MKKSIDLRIEEAQEIGRQRWNQMMVKRDEDQLRRELAKADAEAAKRRARMHVVRDRGAR